LFLGQGLVENRKEAVELCKKLQQKKLVRSLTEALGYFMDSFHYYRFGEDELESSSVLSSAFAGNGSGTHLGQGGCLFSFSPHTAHNSYLIDIALAEEIERAVAGASIQVPTLIVPTIPNIMYRTVYTDYTYIKTTQYNPKMEKTEILKTETFIFKLKSFIQKYDANIWSKKQTTT
jgi:hypothetical protein